MKRIIVLTLVVLVFGICSDAGAYTSSNPRYNPRGGTSGGGSTGDANVWLDMLEGTIEGTPLPTTLTFFKITSFGDTSHPQYSYLGFSGTMSSRQDLNLALPPSSGPNFLLYTNVGDFAAYATFIWTPKGGGDQYDWSVQFFKPENGGYVPSTIGFWNTAELQLGFNGGTPFSVGQLQAAVPVPPSALLLAPGLLGLIVLRRRWIK